MKKFLFPLIGIVSFAINAQAQNGFSELVKSTPADATKLINAYAEPLFKGVGYGMNSGWANTAKANSFLHVDLRISATSVFVPSSDQYFNVTTIGLSNHIGPDDPTKVMAPSFGASKGITGPLMNIYDDNDRKIANFTMPGGQLGYVPTPQIELTVGAAPNTDVSVRAIPNVTPSKDLGTVSLIGVGIKHDILKDFIDKDAHYPESPYDFAIAVGYNHLNYQRGLSVYPDAGAQPADPKQSTDFTNQKMVGHFNSLIVQAILSRKIGIFTPFAAIGYNTATTNASLVGNYPVTTNANLLGQEYYTTFPNPVNISEKSVNSVRGDIGFQIKAGFIRLYASYGIAQYQSVNAGIGFGF